MLRSSNSWKKTQKTVATRPWLTTCWPRKAFSARTCCWRTTSSNSRRSISGTIGRARSSRPRTRTARKSKSAVLWRTFASTACGGSSRSVRSVAVARSLTARTSLRLVATSTSSTCGYSPARTRLTLHDSYRASGSKSPRTSSSNSSGSTRTARELRASSTSNRSPCSRSLLTKQSESGELILTLLFFPSDQSIRQVPKLPTDT